MKNHMHLLHIMSRLNDTINKSIITGHYGEIFRDKDSAIVTKNASSG